MKINIVTPSYRQHNIPELFNNYLEVKKLYPQHDFKWFIVFDKTKIQSISLVLMDLLEKEGVHYEFYGDGGIDGAQQRNRALVQISDGYVYFLDDDNLMNTDLFKALEKYPDKSCLFRLYRRKNKRQITKIIIASGKVDTAQLLVRRETIGNIRWENSYDHDYRFINNVYMANPAEFVFAPEFEAYHNWI